MPSTLLTTSSSKLLQRIGKRANLFGSRHAFSNEQRLFSTEGACESDHFEILGLKPSFSVSQHELKSAYMKLISELHPDRHTLKSLDEQYLFQEKASQVTRAYTILSNPHERAVHLMRLAGKPIDEHSTGKLVGSMFLMEIMELREKIEEISGEAELKALQSNNLLRMEELDGRAHGEN